MAEPSSAHHEYRPDIDGLRAVAVLSVVGFHAFPEELAGGFVGVDIFFVISGYLISGIIFKNLEQNTFSYAEFYRRRIRRIFPALTIVLFACLAFGTGVLLPDELKQLGRHAVAGAAFSSNLLLWREAGYFDALSTHKPLLHLWSLGIEEQFYLIWPTFLAVLWKRSRRSLWAITGVTGFSFAANIWLVRGHAVATFYLPFTRFWELLIGSILAGLSGFRVASVPAVLRRRAVANVASVIGLGLIALAVAVINSSRAFPSWWALLPTVGAAVLIAAGPDAWINRTVLRRRSMVWVGLISYPLYLWHWPLLSFATIVAIPTTGLKLALVGVSFLLAWATWRFVESGLKARASRIGRSADIFTLSMGLSTVCALGGTLLVMNGFPARLTHDGRALANDVGGIDSVVHKLPGPPKLGNLGLCLQSKPGRADAAILGDSHAGSLFFGLAAADNGRNWLAVGHPSCPPTLGITVENDSVGCADKMKQAIDYLIGPEGPPIVVLSFFGYYAETTDVAADHLVNGKGPSHVRLIGARDGASKEEVLADGLANSIELLLVHDKRVYLVIDVPELPFLPRDCVERLWFKKVTTCQVERTAVDERQRGLRRIASRLQGRFPSLQVFDPLPLLCTATQCTPVVGEFAWYRDSHHLSIRGGERVAGQLLGLIDRRAP